MNRNVVFSLLMLVIMVGLVVALPVKAQDATIANMSVDPSASLGEISPYKLA